MPVLQLHDPHHHRVRRPGPGWQPGPVAGHLRSCARTAVPGDGAGQDRVEPPRPRPRGRGGGRRGVTRPARLAGCRVGGGGSAEVHAPVEDHLARVAAGRDRERLREVVDPEAVGDHRREVHPRLQQGGHLVPGLEHLPAVDALDPQPLEDDLVPVDRHRVGEDPEHGDPAAMGHRVEHLAERRGVAAHLQAHVEPLGHALLDHHLAEVVVRDVHHAGRAHDPRQLEAVGVDVGDDHVAGAHVPSDRHGHHADRPGAGDQDVLADHVEAQRRVRGVAVRVEDRGDLVGDGRGHPEEVARRQGEVLGEGAGAADADADGLLAQVPLPGPAAPAVPADDAPLAGDPLTDLVAGDRRTEGGDPPDVLVAHVHPQGDVLLRPVVPVPDVHVGAADRRLDDPDEHVVGSDPGNRDLLHPQPHLGPGLHERAHGGGDRLGRGHRGQAGSPSCDHPQRASDAGEGRHRHVEVLGRLWAADTWVRMRAAARGHDGENESRSHRRPCRAGRAASSRARSASPSMTGRWDRVPGLGAATRGPAAGAEEAPCWPEPVAQRRSERRQEVERGDRGGRDDRPGDRVREQVRPRALAQQPDDLLPARGHVPAAGAPEGLAERAGDDVDAVHHAVVLGRPAARLAHEADGVAVVDHHEGAVVRLGQFADVRQPGQVAVHAEHAVRDHHAEARPGPSGSSNFAFEVGHVVVLVAEPLRLAQPNAVDDAGVVQLVARMASSSPSSGSNSPPFASKHEMYRMASALPKKPAIRVSSCRCRSWVPQMKRTLDRPIPPPVEARRGRPGRCPDGWPVPDNCCAEVDHATAVGVHPGALRRGDHPLALVQPLLGDLGELATDMVEEGGVHGYRILLHPSRAAPSGA